MLGSKIDFTNNFWLKILFTLPIFSQKVRSNVGMTIVDSDGVYNGKCIKHNLLAASACALRTCFIFKPAQNS